MKEALARYRVWLLGWYFAVSAVALMGFGGAAYWVFEGRLLRQTDALLLEHLENDGPPGDGVQLFRFDGAGLPQPPEAVPSWLLTYARDAAEVGDVEATLKVDEDGEEDSEVEHFWRIQGRRLSGVSGIGEGAQGAVLVAVTDLHAFKEMTAGLLMALGVAGVAALLLVGGGGYVLFRRTMAPAEVAFEGMRRFTGDVAHEVRTPLQIIRAEVDVALQQPREAGEYKRALEAVGFEAHRLGQVVDGLLTLARAEAGTSNLAQERVGVDDLIFDALPSCHRLAGPNGITVDVEMEGNARMTGDPVLLRQALLILVDNAVRFGPQGSRVVIRGRPEGREVLLEVDDQGPGIPVSARERSIERFQGERGEGHTGLGLSIVRWIAEAHGGSVVILDAPGGGARVRITLPSETNPS